MHESRSGTLDETLRSLYRTASLVRDRISADTWRIVNQLDLDLLSPRPPNTVRLGDTLSVLNQVFNLLSALSGLMTESMTRGPGWRFVDMGRRLERGIDRPAAAAEDARPQPGRVHSRCWNRCWKSPTAP